jgi:Tfp pilus assembly protein PilP
LRERAKKPTNCKKETRLRDKSKAKPEPERNPVSEDLDAFPLSEFRSDGISNAQIFGEAKPVATENTTRTSVQQA